jgi:Pyruvate/2-oxoacid:ferredoxin oxidoreductase gamma subunit
LNIILGIVPVKTPKRSEPEYSVYMISDCAYRMFYTLSVIKENFVYGHNAGIVEEDTKIHVTTFSVSELRELQAFKINCIFFKPGIYLPHEPLVHEYKVDVFYLTDPANWKENDYFDEKAIIVNLTEESLIYEIERMVSENEEKYIIQKKRKDIKTKIAKQPQSADTEEVDLHIEHLVEDFSGMSAGEILDLQMSRFTIALEGAMKGKTKKMVFIHGIGNGKLKFEIRKALDTKYSRLKYQDASFKEYGYGATMVILK